MSIIVVFVTARCQLLFYKASYFIGCGCVVCSTWSWRSEDSIPAMDFNVTTAFENSSFLQNSSTSAPPTPQHASLGQGIAYVLVALVIMTGNSLVIIAVLRFRFLQTITNMFVVGVACLDFSIGPISILVLVQSVLNEALGDKVPCLARIGIGTMNGLASAFMLLGRYTQGHLKTRLCLL